MSAFSRPSSRRRNLSMGNDGEVAGNRHGLAQALLSLVDDLEVARLIDRDVRSDQEVAVARENGFHVLSRRNLESYLFDEEVLCALVASVGIENKTDELLAKKNASLRLGLTAQGMT